MTVDRYTKLILTVIALELGWIAINGTGVPVLAQRSEATPVIIRGVEGPPGKQPSDSRDRHGIDGPEGRIGTAARGGRLAAVQNRG